MRVRLVYRDGGKADHYEPVTVHSDDLPVLDEEMASELRQLRKGKKTVALVGAATSSCSLAPYGEDTEIWALNEQHAYPWMKRATRWFQIHKPEKWHPFNLKWMQENPLKIPIYLQFIRPDIPNSTEYPLQKVVDTFFPLFRRGKKKVKYLTSSFSLMFALALLEGYRRIEIYGFEMSDELEYEKQRPCGEFWIGMAMGMGVEIYTPDNCQLLNGELYGYN